MLKLSNDEEDNLSYRVENSTNRKNMFESHIDDEIHECNKSVNGPIKNDITLQKKKIIAAKAQMKKQTIYQQLQ